MVALGAAPSETADLPEWIEKTEISGLAFGDGYWMVENHDQEIDGANGFWFRRIYLTFDFEMSEQLSVRLRFEANTPGDFESGGNIEPFVKDAYIQWKGENLEALLGLSPTPTWSVIEAFWGYRPVEKTLLDLQRLGSARDAGVAVKGRFGADRKFYCHAMVGNGANTEAETNEGKKAMLALGYSPSDRWVFEVYGDYDERPGETDRTTYQLFAGYRGAWGRMGIQGARQHREVSRGEALDLDGASLFAVFELTEKLNLLTRLDRMFDPNPDGDRIAYLPFDPTAESSLVILGFDYRVHKHFSLIPNVEYISYDREGGADPEDDLMLRLTFFFRF